MITISSKYTKLPSFRYIVKLIFNDWFNGPSINFTDSTDPGYTIIFQNGKKISFTSSLFEYIFNNGVDRGIIDLFQITNLNLSGFYVEKFGIKTVPFIHFSKKKYQDKIELSSKHFNLDILGITFFLIARVDEYLNNSSDIFDRFRGIDTLAYKHNYLNLPLADIYCNIFMDHIHYKTDEIFHPNNSYENNITCDVDNPHLYQKRPLNIIRRAGGDLLIRNDLNSFLRNIVGSMSPVSLTKNIDPFRRGIDHIMSTNDQYSNSVRFNFIPFHTNDRYDGENMFGSVLITDLLKKILARGHEIGIHPGFDTYMSPTNMKNTVESFKSVLADLGVSNVISGRQHYLRWKTGTTEAILSESGINEDSSLNFADTGGFRCATTKPFILYDIKNDRKTHVLEKPLIVMETTYFGKGYLDLHEDDIFDHMNNLKQWCRKMNGTFTLLWHNCGLQTDRRVEIYEQILKS